MLFSCLPYMYRWGKGAGVKHILRSILFFRSARRSCRAQGAADSDFARRHQLQISPLWIVDPDVVFEQPASFSSVLLASDVVELGIGGAVEQDFGGGGGAGGLRTGLGVWLEGGQGGEGETWCRCCSVSASASAVVACMSFGGGGYLGSGPMSRGYRGW